jgi:hypothetical protein
VRRSGSSATGLETEVARLAQELNQAREQQAATSEILSVISRSEFDLGAVLEKLVEKTVHVCGAERGLIWRQDGGLYRVAAAFGKMRAMVEGPRSSVRKWAGRPLRTSSDAPRMASSTGRQLRDKMPASLTPLPWRTADRSALADSGKIRAACGPNTALVQCVGYGVQGGRRTVSAAD